MRRRNLLTGFAILTISLRALAAETPKDVVEDLYRRAAAKKGQWGSPLLNATLRKRIFSKAFLRLWTAADARNRKGEVGWLDFDILSNSQDPSVNDLRVTVANEIASKVTIRAAFRYDPDPKSEITEILFDFIPEDASWKLDDIRGNAGADSWSVRKLAQDAAAAKS